ncbi:MAG: phosphatase PAP2 family protein [Clostridiales bacterium]|nr:phosphatase PAP2 family protein [Clostridiales bacterium]
MGEIQFLNWIYQTFHQGDFAWLTTIVTWITHLGETGIGSIILAVILLIIPKTRKGGVVVAVAIILDFLLVNIIIKNAVARPRPWLNEDAVFNQAFLDGLLFNSEGFTGILQIPPVGEYSFPSGHSGIAFCAAVAVFMCYKKKWVRIVALTVASLVALSRLYLCVHYPTDVLVGALVGSACGIAAYFIVNGVALLIKNKTKKEAE